MEVLFHNIQMVLEVEQVSVMMLDTEEVEVKAVLALNATIFEQKQEQFMVDVNEEPLDVLLPLLYSYF